VFFITTLSLISPKCVGGVFYAFAFFLSLGKIGVIGSISLIAFELTSKGKTQFPF
jgi:hypothetical protein